MAVNENKHKISILVALISTPLPGTFKGLGMNKGAIYFYINCLSVYSLGVFNFVHHLLRGSFFRFARSGTLRTRLDES